jgi:hypothetical protein
VISQIGPRDRSEATSFLGRRSFGFLGRLFLSFGVASDLKLVGVVDEAVQDGVGDGGVADPVMPLGDGELTRNDRRGSAVSILHHFEEVMALGFGGSTHAEIIEDEEVRLGELGEELRIRSVGPGESDFVEEPRDTSIEDPQAATTGGLAKSRGEVALADSRRSRDQDVEVIADPLTGGELTKQSAINASRRRGVDVFDACAGDSKLRIFQSSRKAPVVASEVLGVDEHGEALVEGEGACCGVTLLGLPGFRHRAQTQRVKFL